MKKYSEKEWAEMVEMRNQGATYKQIGEMFGRTTHAVEQKFSQMGMNEKRPPPA